MEKYAKAERSFYKLVAKSGAYSLMRKRQTMWGDIYYTRFPSNYTHGMPVFRSTRGQLMSEWEEQFFLHTKRGKEMAWHREQCEMRDKEYCDRIAKAEADGKEFQELERILELRNGAHRFIMNSKSLNINDVPEEICELQNLLTEVKRAMKNRNKTKETQP